MREMGQQTGERLTEVRKVVYVMNRLRQIERRLRGIGVRGCNGYHSESQEKRDNTTQERLRDEAYELAKGIGLRFYHQTDPRGCAVYLIDDTMDDSTYNRGIAVSS